MKTFEEWGPEFHVEFDITIYQIPDPGKSKWIFKIGNGATSHYGWGDVFPAAIMNTNNGCIYIYNTLQGNSDSNHFCPQLNKTSHVAIKQIRNSADAQNIYFSINVDGENVHNAKNDAAKTYKHVMFHASPINKGPFSPLTSEFGIIENMIVYQSMYCTIYLNNVIIPT